MLYANFNRSSTPLGSDESLYRSRFNRLVF
jgi:hypothetical protein